MTSGQGPAAAKELQMAKSECLVTDVGEEY